MLKKWIFLFWVFVLESVIVISARASMEERIIYIQEDSQSILTTVSSLLLAGAWKEIVSTIAAFLCVSAMVILAINHKKP